LLHTQVGRCTSSMWLLTRHVMSHVGTRGGRRAARATCACYRPSHIGGGSGLGACRRLSVKSFTPPEPPSAPLTYLRRQSQGGTLRLSGLCNRRVVSCLPSRPRRVSALPLCMWLSPRIQPGRGVARGTPTRSLVPSLHLLHRDKVVRVRLRELVVQLEEELCLPCPAA
jgi:hypothetical protein